MFVQKEKIMMNMNAEASLYTQETLHKPQAYELLQYQATLKWTIFQHFTE